MILSKKNKFLFIKGRKVAGTSVEIMLSQLCGSEDIITPILPIEEKYRIMNISMGAQNYGAGAKNKNDYLNMLRNVTCNKSLLKIKPPAGKYRNHMSYKQVIKKFGPIPADWLIFAIERSPYAKVISRANHRLKSIEYSQGNIDEMKSDIPSIKYAIDRAIETGSILKTKNINLYKNNDNEIQAKIIRYESLEPDLVSLLASIGIQSKIKLPHFKKGILSSELNVSEILSKQQIKSINTLFEEEFIAFKYDMIC